MQKWEYKVVTKAKAEQLNELGEQGWELVSVSENLAYYTFIFKRPKS